jgi:hypothetical protein
MFSFVLLHPRCHYGDVLQASGGAGEHGPSPMSHGQAAVQQGNGALQRDRTWLLYEPSKTWNAVQDKTFSPPAPRQPLLTGGHLPP